MHFSKIDFVIPVNEERLIKSGLTAMKLLKNKRELLSYSINSLVSHSPMKKELIMLKMSVNSLIVKTETIDNVSDFLKWSDDEIEILMNFLKEDISQYFIQSILNADTDNKDKDDINDIMNLFKYLNSHYQEKNNQLFHQI